MDGNRVTAGLPSLSPGLRSAITKARINREMSRQRLLDHVARETATTAKDGDIDTTSPDAQMGLPLSVAEMQRRLKLCNSAFHFEVSNHDPSKMGIYIIESTGKRFVCGMQNSVMPERSIRVAKEKKVPDADHPEWKTIRRIDHEIRGWRTVLVMLLHSRLITQAQIDRHWPVSSGASRNWQVFTN